ncbi:MAG: 2-oxoacid:acceptor oxidoreductase subunit alpha, partial [Parcubacteria group bacterium CG_4_8_14_3_um_filter_48_16]
MPKIDFNWRIGGRAGEGIMVSGLLMSKTFTRGGLHIFTNTEHPSLIRGGHNTIRIRASDQPVHAQVDTVHLLVALNQDTVDLHAHELPSDGGVIFDPDVVKNTGNISCKRYPIPLKQIVQEVGGTPVMINMVALGASLALLRYPIASFEQLIKEQYAKRKGAEVVKKNIAAARK